MQAGDILENLLRLILKLQLRQTCISKSLSMHCLLKLKMTPPKRKCTKNKFKKKNRGDKRPIFSFSELCPTVHYSTQIDLTSLAGVRILHHIHSVCQAACLCPSACLCHFATLTSVQFSSAQFSSSVWYWLKLLSDSWIITALQASGWYKTFVKRAQFVLKKGVKVISCKTNKKGSKTGVNEKRIYKRNSQRTSEKASCTWQTESEVRQIMTLNFGVA